VPGALLQAIEDKRVLIVYDEITVKLKSRSSALYKAHEFMIKHLRKRGEPRILNLTATPMDKGPVDTFNAMRILAPWTVPTVDEFDKQYVLAYDLYENPKNYKNLTPDSMISEDVVPFVERFAPIRLRRRKTDPELVDYFPKRVEEYIHVVLDDKQSEFYDTVVETYESPDGDVVPGLFTVLRQIAGDPRSLLISEGKLAQEIVGIVGGAGIRAIGSTKGERLQAHLQPLVKGQGAKVVVFSFFTSVLHWIKSDLEALGYKIAYHHGGQTATQNDAAKRYFRDGDAEIFLTSDAGSRGLNLPGALYTIEYEGALTHSLHLQRMDRNHRIDSTFPSVTNFTMVAVDTVEEGIISLGHKRNAWQDLLLGDDEADESFMSAKQRRVLTRISRKNAVEAT
jgi:SNF2 family DNA or RNA helicase